MVESRVRQEISELKHKLKSRSITPLQRLQDISELRLRESLLTAYEPKEKAEDLRRASLRGLADATEDIGRPGNYPAEYAKSIALHNDSMKSLEEHEWRMWALARATLRQAWPLASWPHRQTLFRGLVVPMPYSISRIAGFRWRRVFFPWTITVTAKLLGL